MTLTQHSQKISESLDEETRGEATRAGIVLEQFFQFADGETAI